MNKTVVWIIGGTLVFGGLGALAYFMLRPKNNDEEVSLGEGEEDVRKDTERRSSERTEESDRRVRRDVTTTTRTPISNRTTRSDGAVRGTTPTRENPAPAPVRGSGRMPARR